MYNIGVGFRLSTDKTLNPSNYYIRFPNNAIVMKSNPHELARDDCTYIRYL